MIYNNSCIVKNICKSKKLVNHYRDKPDFSFQTLMTAITKTANGFTKNLYCILVKNVRIVISGIICFFGVLYY